MQKCELTEQTIPGEEGAYGFMVTAFGKHFGLATDEPPNEQFIKTFCRKAEETLLLELKEYSK